MRIAFSHEALRRKDSGCLTHHSRVSFNCGGKAHGFFVGHSLLFVKANRFFGRRSVFARGFVGRSVFEKAYYFFGRSVFDRTTGF